MVSTRAKSGSESREAERPAAFRPVRWARPSRGRPPAPDRDYLPYLLLKEAPAEDERATTLVVAGIDADCRASVLMSRTVAEAGVQDWLDLLVALKERYPVARSLRLVVLDGPPPLASAVERVWPNVRRQLCWFQELRSLLKLLDPTTEAACLAGAWAIPEAPSHAAAVSAYRRWAERWRTRLPAAVQLIQRDLPFLLAFLTEPPEVRGALRSIDGFCWMDGVAPSSGRVSTNYEQTPQVSRLRRVYMK
jgi:hypothetical protein